MPLHSSDLFAMPVGTRLELRNLRLAWVTPYVEKNRYGRGNKEQTLYAHTFFDRFHQRITYTGSKCLCAIGTDIDLCATIKRRETSAGGFPALRISRPRVLPRAVPGEPCLTGLAL